MANKNIMEWLGTLIASCFIYSERICLILFIRALQAEALTKTTIQLGEANDKN